MEKPYLFTRNRGQHKSVDVSPCRANSHWNKILVLFPRLQVFTISVFKSMQESVVFSTSIGFLHSAYYKCAVLVDDSLLSLNSGRRFLGAVLYFAR